MTNPDYYETAKRTPTEEDARDGMVLCAWPNGAWFDVRVAEATDFPYWRPMPASPPAPKTACERAFEEHEETTGVKASWRDFTAGWEAAKKEQP